MLRMRAPRHHGPKPSPSASDRLRPPSARSFGFAWRLLLSLALLWLATTGTGTTQPAASLTPLVTELKTFRGPGIAGNPAVEALPMDVSGLAPTRPLAWSLGGGEPFALATSPFEVRPASPGVLLVGASASCPVDEVASLDMVVFSTAGDRALLFFPEMHGDISRWRVELIDLVSRARSTVTIDPVSFAEFTPDGRYILTEGPALIDAEPGAARRTRLEVGPDLPYPRVLGWIASGPGVVLVTYSHWEAPQQARQIRIDFEPMKERRR